MNTILKKSLFAIALFMLTCIVSSPISQAKTIFVTKENFPDKKLRSKIKKYDKNRNGRLERSEQKKIKKLAIYTKKDVNVNIKGISKCKELKQLTIWADGTVKNLDEISKVRKLENLKLSGTANLNRIRVKKMKNLKKLSIEYCKNADEIVVQDNKKLKKMQIIVCENVDEVVIKSNPNLTYLYAYGNSGSTHIDIIRNSRLETICFEEDESLKELKVMKLKSLKVLQLWCVKKKMTKLQYDKMLKLKEFALYDSYIDTIDFEKIPNVTRLHYGNNSFEVLDFTKLTKLNELWISDTKIKQLDVTMLSGLRNLDCTNCQLQELKVAENNKIDTLRLNNNLLSGVWDLNMFPNLRRFECNNNTIEKILARDHKKIFSISCNANNLKEIDVYDTDLYYLWGKQNPNAMIYLPMKPYGDMTYSFDTTAKVTYQSE